LDPFDVLNDSVVRIAGDGTIAGFNTESELLYGCDRSDAIGRDFAELFGEEAAADWPSRLRTQDRWRGEVVRQARAGPMLVSLHWVARRDDAGALIEILETGRCIEDVRKLRLSADESSFRYQNLFQSLAVAFFETDFRGVGSELKRLHDAGVTDLRAYLTANPEHVRRLMSLENVVTVNDAAVKLFGASCAEDLTGMRSERLWPDESLPDYIGALMAVIERQSHFVCETRLNALDERKIDAFFTVAWSPESAKRGVMIVGIVDLGGRNRAYAELARSEANYRHLFDAMSVGLVEHDFTDVDVQLSEYRAAGISDLEAHMLGDPQRIIRMLEAMHVTAVNDQALRIFGVDRPDELPSGMRWLWPEDNYEMVARAIGGRYRRELMPPTDTRIRQRDGSTVDVTVAIWAEPERRTGQPVLAAFMDISDRVAAQQRLERVRAEFAHASRISTLGELAASIAHEVSQPLSAIVSNAVIAGRMLERSGTAGHEPLLALIQHTIDAAKRAANIVSRIRLAAAPIAAQWEPLSLNDIVDEAMQFVAQEMSQSGVSCARNLDADLPLVTGDRVQLQQVVVNLLLNATQAMQDVATGERGIIVSTWRHGARANVRIDDTGHGLPPENLETVFDSFYTTKEGGMGIGLAVCRSIVEQHGGVIAAIALPLGARFEFSLLTMDPGGGR